MDGEPDLEMPSPKRMRLEVSKPEMPNDVPPQADRLDLYETPAARAGNPDKVLPIDAPNHAVLPPSTTSKPFHLPGLKLLNGEPTQSNGYQEPNLDCKVVEAANIVSTNDRGQCGSAGTDPGDKSELNGKKEITPEHTSVVSTGVSGVTDSVPWTISPDTKGSPMEDVLIGVAPLEQHVAEERGKIQTDEGLQEATFIASKTLVQDQIQEDGPPKNEEPHATDTGPNAAMQAQTEVLQEESVTKDADDDKQDLFTEIGTVDAPPKTMGPTSPTFKEVAEANKSNAEAEFEIDSSPYESSSSDISTDSSSSDDSEDDNDADDYEMLSPEEEARRLMAEDGGVEEKTTADVPRTLNEKPDVVVPKPQVIVTANMKIEELGRVENLVENLAVIKANTSGEYQVLESGSVLCLEDRSVIGAIAETLGRVQQPYYSVRFSNRAAIEEAGVSQNTKVFYVTQHSRTVFTQPLKAYKGSDASNLHDEEVGDDELEFSDDEAEAEHKRQVKLQKRARYDAKHGHENGVLGVSQPRPGAPKNLPNKSSRPSNAAELSLNYDDAGEDSDDLYTPLARPSNLHEMMNGQDVPSKSHANRGDNDRGGRGRGRGDRGRGRGGRGRGNDRGGRPDRRGQDSSRGNGHSHAHPNMGQSSSPTTQSNGFDAPTNNSLPPRPSHQSNGSHSHPQTQHLPVQPPSYPAHSFPPPHMHPNYAPQYPPLYSQPYPQQHQQPQYQYQDPYLQGISHQGYIPQQPFSPGLQYPVQQTPPAPHSPAAIPPGAHINPNFFRQQAQLPPQPWYHNQG